MTDDLEVITGPVTITNPRWEHKDPAKKENSPDTAAFGDTVLLMADVSGVPEGITVSFDIYETAENPPMVTASARGKNQKGIGKAEWVVTDKSGKGAESKLEFEGIVKSKASTRAEIPVVVLSVINSNTITDSVGLNGKNKTDDVLIIKKKLKELGYPITDMSGNCNKELINAIKFFQISFIDVAACISNHKAPRLPDDLISKDGATSQQLFGTNPQRYIAPAKGLVKPIADDIKPKISSAIGNNKTLWDGIVSKWNQVSPYLPSDSKLSSGYRSPDDQRAILHNWFNVVYKPDIVKMFGNSEWQKYKNMQGINDVSADPVMCKMIKDATGQLIAVPGTSQHQVGKAIDIGGQADEEQVKALLWCHVSLGNDAIKKILPEKISVYILNFKKG